MHDIIQCKAFDSGDRRLAPLHHTSVQESNAGGGAIFVQFVWLFLLCRGHTGEVSWRI